MHNHMLGTGKEVIIFLCAYAARYIHNHDNAMCMAQLMHNTQS